MKALKCYYLYYLLFLLCGCATLFGSKTQNVSFRSLPSGSMVYIDDAFVGKTPVTVQLLLKDIKHKKKNHKAQSQKDDDVVNEMAEEICLLKHNRHKVTYIKQGFQSIEFFIESKSIRSNSTNQDLCSLDIFGSLFALGVPFIVDAKSYACGGFDKIYTYDLSNAHQIPAPEQTQQYSELGLSKTNKMLLGG